MNLTTSNMKIFFVAWLFLILQGAHAGDTPPTLEQGTKAVLMSPQLSLYEEPTVVSRCAHPKRPVGTFIQVLKKQENGCLVSLPSKIFCHDQTWRQLWTKCSELSMDSAVIKVVEKFFALRDNQDIALPEAEKSIAALKKESASVFPALVEEITKLEGRVQLVHDRGCSPLSNTEYSTFTLVSECSERPSERDECYAKGHYYYPGNRIRVSKFGAYWAQDAGNGLWMATKGLICADRSYEATTLRPGGISQSLPPGEKSNLKDSIIPAGTPLLVLEKRESYCHIIQPDKPWNTWVNCNELVSNEIAVTAAKQLQNVRKWFKDYDRATKTLAIIDSFNKDPNFPAELKPELSTVADEVRKFLAERDRENATVPKTCTVYGEYAATIYDSPGIACNNIEIRRRVKKEVDPCKDPSAKLVYSSIDQMGVWFKNIDHDWLILDLGTGPDRGISIFDLSKSRNVFSADGDLKEQKPGWISYTETNQAFANPGEPCVQKALEAWPAFKQERKPAFDKSNVPDCKICESWSQSLQTGFDVDVDLELGSFKKVYRSKVSCGARQ
jgi:hypothetical protein